MGRVIFLFLVAFSSLIIQAGHKRHDLLRAEGDKGWVPIKSLHPTQFAMGYREVESRKNELAAFSTQDAYDEYLEENEAPLVLGPGGTLYLVDHHHLARAVLDSGGRVIHAFVEKDWSHLKGAAFWDEMKKNGFVYLYDEKGKVPRDPSELEDSLSALPDDPYRSLAYFVKKRGGYHLHKGRIHGRSKFYFAEFKWARFFQSRVSLGTTDADFAGAIEEALKIVHSPEASKLPGYTKK